MSIVGGALTDFQTELSATTADADGCQRRAGFSLGLISSVLALLCGAAPAFAADSGNGLVDGRMCVRPVESDDKVGDQAGDCGPVEIALQSGSRAVVRISDVVYRLQLHANQVDIVLMHGAMQVDGFSASYEWQGKTLHFSDPEKGVRYEIAFDPAAKRTLRRSGNGAAR